MEESVFARGYRPLVDISAKLDGGARATHVDVAEILAAADKFRGSMTIDWIVRESARAKIRVMVRRILRKRGYPPALQVEATKTVRQGRNAGHETAVWVSWDLQVKAPVAFSAFTHVSPFTRVFFSTQAG